MMRWCRVWQGVLAALLGVQSSRRARQHLNDHSVWPYVLAAAITAALLLAGLMTLALRMAAL